MDILVTGKGALVDPEHIKTLDTAQKVEAEINKVKNSDLVEADGYKQVVSRESYLTFLNQRLAKIKFLTAQERKQEKEAEAKKETKKETKAKKETSSDQLEATVIIKRLMNLAKARQKQLDDLKDTYSHKQDELEKHYQLEAERGAELAKAQISKMQKENEELKKQLEDAKCPQIDLDKIDLDETKQNSAKNRKNLNINKTLSDIIDDLADKAKLTSRSKFRDVGEMLIWRGLLSDEETAKVAEQLYPKEDFAAILKAVKNFK